LTEFVVYIDLYIFLNLFINGCIIYIVSRIIGKHVGLFKLLFSDLFASFLGLSICLPSMNIYFSIFYKFISSIIITCIAFGFKNIISVLKNSFIYMSVSITYSALVIWSSSIFILKNIIYINNIEIYYNLPVSFTVIFMMFLLLFYYVISKIKSIKNMDSLIYDCLIVLHGKKIDIRGFLDTGNSLCDIITGLPVIIIGKSAAKSIIPDIEGFLSMSSVSEKYKIIPYKTADGKCNILPAFKPDKVYLNDCEVDVIVAVSKDNFSVKQGFNCLLNRYCIK